MEIVINNRCITFNDTILLFLHITKKKEIDKQNQKKSLSCPLWLVFSVSACVWSTWSKCLDLYFVEIVFALLTISRLMLANKKKFYFQFSTSFTWSYGQKQQQQLTLKERIFYRAPTPPPFAKIPLLPLNRDEQSIHVSPLSFIIFLYEQPWYVPCI